MKMICLDIDGTLLNSQMEISDRTKKALISAQEKGMIVVLSSARPAVGMQKTTKELKIAEYGGIVSAFNGGEIQRAATGEVIEKTYLTQTEISHIYTEIKKIETASLTALLDKRPKAETVNARVAKEISKLVSDMALNIMTYNQGVLYTADDDKYTYIECLLNQMGLKIVEDFVEELNFDSPKILVSVDPKNGKEAKASFVEVLGTSFEITSSDPFFIEITPKGVNKGNSTEKIADLLGIEMSEVVAFGDSHNDIPMLKVAGRGVAMMNASDEVKAIADDVTASNDEDGIAIIIEQYI